MTAIRYGFHFALLALAALAYDAMRVFIFGFSLDSFLFTYGLIGFLHATTIVVSLRDHELDGAWKEVFFIALAAGWSVVTAFSWMIGVIIGAAFSDLMSGLQAPPAVSLTFVFLIGSAIGSSGYWLMVRLFWVKSLGFVDWLRTVAFCLAATLSASIVMEGLGQLDLNKMKTDLPWTVLWWVAFSASLYWSETKKVAHKSLQSAESAS